MRVDFTLGTGWPYGGPWIPLELGSKCIVRTVDEVIGPDRYGVKIPGDIGEHEKLIGLFAAQTMGSDEVLDPRSIVDLRPYLRYTDPQLLGGGAAGSGLAGSRRKVEDHRVQAGAHAAGGAGGGAGR